MNNLYLTGKNEIALFKKTITKITATIDYLLHQGIETGCKACGHNKGKR